MNVFGHDARLSPRNLFREEIETCFHVLKEYTKARRPEALSGEVNLHSCSGKAKICVTVVKEYSQSAFSICLFLYAAEAKDVPDSVKDQKSYLFGS